MGNQFQGISIDDKHNDTLSCDKLQFQIDARLIQIHGHLFTYDHDHEENKLVAQDTWLCIDKIVSEQKYCYMLNVVDKEQKTSYTRIKVTKDPQFNYSFSE